MTTQIATWFVRDDEADATFFPQIGLSSSASAAHQIYWRCTAVFFASSLAKNPHYKHCFYTNCDLPTIDGVDFAKLFDGWDIEVVHLPVRHRLPAGKVESWGNQFYVFDVLDHFASSRLEERLILLDSDCLWLRSADEMSLSIDRHGALTLPLGHDEHAQSEPINGLTREGMARFLCSHGGPVLNRIEYCGGEILAVNRDTAGRICTHAQRLWPQIIDGAPDAPREEAHLLSVIYALEGLAMGSADSFIRRMWTTFRHNNLKASDADLSIWHLPAEKRTGFAELFALICARPHLDPRFDADAIGLDFPAYCKAMGWPNRGPKKLARDLALKFKEKAA